MEYALPGHFTLRRCRDAPDRNPSLRRNLHFEPLLASSFPEMLPIGVKQLLVHGSIDIDVPVVISRRYAAAATAAGDEVNFIELADAHHMDFIDPSSGAHAAWCSRLTT